MSTPSSELVSNKKVIKFSYEWTISDFQSRSVSLESPIFSNETYDNIRWRLQIQSKGAYDYHFNRDNQTLTMTWILVSNDAKYKIQSNGKFQLLSTIPKYTRTWNQVFQEFADHLNCFNLLPTHEILNPEKGYLKDDKVTITCEIISIIKVSKPVHIIPDCPWQNHLEAIFENGKFPDVTLCASDKEYRVHKVILAARSPVFNAMFEHEMLEVKQGRVEIADIDGEALGELLRFIYTGKLLNVNNFAFDLLPAAEKYQLENLKVLCEKELCSSISVENAAEVLVLADTYNLDQLKAVAISFLGSHSVDIAKTSGWQSMLKSHVGLLIEVLCDLVQERDFLLSLHKF